MDERQVRYTHQCQGSTGGSKGQAIVTNMRIYHLWRRRASHGPPQRKRYNQRSLTCFFASGRADSKGPRNLLNKYIVSSDMDCYRGQESILTSDPATGVDRPMLSQEHQLLRQGSTKNLLTLNLASIADIKSPREFMTVITVSSSPASSSLDSCPKRAMTARRTSSKYL